MSGSTGPIFTIRFFHHMEGICVNVVNLGQFFIPQGTLQWQPILGKIGEMTFIQHPGILKRS